MTRPTTAVAWYAGTTEFITNWETNYLNAGLCTSFSETESADGLSITYVAVWKDALSLYKYEADPINSEHLASRSEYEAANGIRVSRTAA